MRWTKLVGTANFSITRGANAAEGETASNYRRSQAATVGRRTGSPQGQVEERIEGMNLIEAESRCRSIIASLAHHEGIEEFQSQTAQSLLREIFAELRKDEKWLVNTTRQQVHQVAVGIFKDLEAWLEREYDSPSARYADFVHYKAKYLKE